MKINLSLLLLWSIIGKLLTPQNEGLITHTYEYQDSKTQQVVEVRFITEKHVAYTMRFLDKQTKKLCETHGDAFWDDPTGNGALTEDEDGTSYGVVDFYSKRDPLYTSLSFEYPQNGKVSISRRLQVFAVDSSIKGACHFSSKHTLRRIK